MLINQNLMTIKATATRKSMWLGREGNELMICLMLRAPELKLISRDLEALAMSLSCNRNARWELEAQRRTASQVLHSAVRGARIRTNGACSMQRPRDVRDQMEQCWAAGLPKPHQTGFIPYLLRHGSLRRNRTT